MEDFLEYPQGKDWGRLIAALRPLLTKVQTHDIWPTPDTVDQATDYIKKSLPDDLKALKTDAGFLFLREEDSESLTEQNVNLLRRWHLQGQVPSLTSLCIFAYENLQLNLTQDVLNALLTASILGEVENTLTYHNNMHYRKVVLQLIRLIVTHNDIYQGTSHALIDEQIALLLMAACIHDLGHDGKGNTLKGVFIPSRLEKRSFELAKPYLESVGYNVEAALEGLRVMILCTDVTPLDDPANLMNQMKAAYRFHYLGENRKFEALNLDSDLAPLQKNSKLAIMGLLMHEADIATSAGLDYDLTTFETSIYRRELNAEDAAPSHVVEFITMICQRKMLSNAGQKLYAGNMARILALAEEAMRSSNQPFPKPEHADFLNFHARSGASSSTKTIN